MKVSIIVAVYKDIQALDLIVKALEQQTYKNFELVVAEDNNSEAMRNYTESVKSIVIKHTYQEDIGVRKARSQNNGILAAEGELLIFIDGDCIPYTTFVEAHAILAQKGVVRSGRRLNLPLEFSKKMREGKLLSWKLEKSFWKYIPKLLMDKESRVKQGIYFNPKGWIYRTFVERQKRSSAILGCNFACFRSDMIAINGFDESYGESAVSDDMDLDWRFRAYGLKLKSCKNAANVFHLHHKAHDRGDASSQVMQMREREATQEFICELGLNTHTQQDT
ncbi:MAG TPA: glycosyltransferase [Sulfuricurvum sp.]|nr:glycosyltransferase [Sulfuricurvum sp.]